MTIPVPPEGYPPYIFQEFPKWKYHKDFKLEEATGTEIIGKAQVVESHDAEVALGKDWFDTPEEARDAREPKPAEAKIPEPVMDYRSPGFKREAKA